MNNKPKEVPDQSQEAQRQEAWTALFTNEQNFIDFLKWQKLQSGEKLLKDELFIDILCDIVDSLEGRKDGTFDKLWFSGRLMQLKSALPVHYYDKPAQPAEEWVAAVGFAEWIHTHWYKWGSDGLWWSKVLNTGGYTSKELYDIFKVGPPITKIKNEYE